MVVVLKIWVDGSHDRRFSWVQGEWISTWTGLPSSCQEEELRHHYLKCWCQEEDVQNTYLKFAAEEYTIKSISVMIFITEAWHICKFNIVCLIKLKLQREPDVRLKRPYLKQTRTQNKDLHHTKRPTWHYNGEWDLDSDMKGIWIRVHRVDSQAIHQLWNLVCDRPH